MKHVSSEEAAMVKILHPHTDLFYNKTLNIKNQSNKRQKSLSSLQSLITPIQKKKIVKRIFTNDENAYDDLILKLEVTDNWRDAWHIVESELNKRNIAVHEPDAVFFTDILYYRYFAESAKP